MSPNPAYLEALQESVRTAPYPQLIGLSLSALQLDSCRIDLELGERHMQPFGIVHGGVLATLIDTVTFWAGFLRLPEDAGLVNVDLKLTPEGGHRRIPACRRPLPAGRATDQLHRMQRVRRRRRTGRARRVDPDGDARERPELGIRKFVQG